MLSVKVEGLKDLEKALFQLKNTTAKSTVRRAAKKALIQTRDKAIQLAPYGQESGPLHLKEGIEVSTKGTRTADKGKSGVEVYCGVVKEQSKVGIQQEFGNVNHAAQPFMRPAWDTTKMNVLYTFRDELAVEVKKATERAERKAAREAAKLRR